MNEDLPWMVNFSATALADYDEIVKRSRLSFEAQQSKKYVSQINKSVMELARSGDKALLLRRRLELQPVIHSYPVARIGQPASHQLFVSFGTERGDRTINILRILHNRMDFGSHLLVNQLTRTDNT